MGQLFSNIANDKEEIEPETHIGQKHECRRCHRDLEIRLDKYSGNFSAKQIKRWMNSEVERMICDNCLRNLRYDIPNYFSNGNDATDIDYNHFAKTLRKTDMDFNHCAKIPKKSPAWWLSNKELLNHYLRNVCLQETSNCRINDYVEFQINCCQALIDIGADVNSRCKDEDEITPLSNACMDSGCRDRNRPKLVMFLLENGADPDTVIYGGDTGFTVLMECCSNAQKEYASLLISHGAKLYRTTTFDKLGAKGLDGEKQVSAIDLYGYDGFWNTGSICQHIRRIHSIFIERNELIREYFEKKYPGQTINEREFPRFLSFRERSIFRLIPKESYIPKNSQDIIYPGLIELKDLRLDSISKMQTIINKLINEYFQLCFPKITYGHFPDYKIVTRYTNSGFLLSNGYNQPYVKPIELDDEMNSSKILIRSKIDLLIHEYFELVFPGYVFPNVLLEGFLAFSGQRTDSSIYSSAMTDLNALPLDNKRSHMKAMALEIRNYIISHKKSKFSTKGDKKAINLIIHFDDKKRNIDKPFPSHAVQAVEKAYAIMQSTSLN